MSTFDVDEYENCDYAEAGRRRRGGDYHEDEEEEEEEEKEEEEEEEKEKEEEEEKEEEKTVTKELIQYLSGLEEGNDEHMSVLYHHVCGLVDTANEIYGPDRNNSLKEESLLKLSRFIQRQSKGELSGGVDKKGRVDQEELCRQLRQLYKERPGLLIRHLGMNDIPLDWKKLIVGALAKDTKEDSEERELLIRSLKNLSLVNKEFNRMVQAHYIGEDKILASERKRLIHEFFVSILNFDTDGMLCSGYSILTSKDKNTYSCALQMRQFILFDREYIGVLDNLEPGIKHTYNLLNVPKLFEIRVTKRIAKILDTLHVKNTLTIDELNKSARWFMDRRLTADESVRFWHRGENIPIFPPGLAMFQKTRGYRNIPEEYDNDQTANEEVLWQNSYKRYYKVTRDELDSIMLNKVAHLLDVLDVDIEDEDSIVDYYCIVDMSRAMAILEYLSEIGEIDLIGDNALVVVHPTYSRMLFGISMDAHDDGFLYTERELSAEEEENNFLAGAIDLPRYYAYWDVNRDKTMRFNTGNICYLLIRSCLTQENGALYLDNNDNRYPEVRIQRLVIATDTNEVDWTMHYYIRDGPCISFRENFLPMSTRGAWRRTLGGNRETRRMFREQINAFDIPTADITTKPNNNNNNNNV
jgi:hypothetical protein